MRTPRVISTLLLLALGCDAPIEAGSDASTTPVDASTDGGTDAGIFELQTEPVLPTATGTCPDFFSGDTITVAPAGIAPRQVRVWIGDAANDLDGPLVFYWHGAGGSPNEAPVALSRATIDAVTAAGGIVVAPVHDPGAGDFPWYLTLGTEENDLLVADEVVACAIAQVGIDTTHIHSVGFSAGALHNAQMGIRRASYVASYVCFSGGVVARRRIPTDAPDARPAALLFHGGESDIVLTQFEEATLTYRAMLDAMGYFSVLCDHGMGHTVPQAGLPSVWTFLSDHPFGTYPSPYEGGLPSGFYDVCGL